MNERAVRVEVYSDVICPWCYVGKRRLERALKAWGGVPVNLHWRPFQLNPTMPRNGMDRRQYLEAKFGGPGAAQAIYDQVAVAGVSEGIQFAFERIVRTPNTFAAHRLIWWAGQQGKQDEMVERLFRQYFLEGGDIGDRDALSQAAVDVGLDRAIVDTFLTSEGAVEEVRREEAAGHRLGIRGVPYFVINGTSALSGAQLPEQLVAAFREGGVGLAMGKAGG
jgi:predicted DsbA family dithiol-disulfide isomerase